MDNIINFDEIEIFDDQLSELEMLKRLINKRQTEAPLHMLNVGDVLRKHQVWMQKLPRVVPYFAIKSNSDPTIIKLLAALGSSFDCASKEEIIQVMNYGVSSDRIIFANTVKFPSHIEYAKKVGVSKMTVDTENELRKIKLIYPKARILIRITCDAKIETARMGEKFGCEPNKDVFHLINTTIALGLELCGFSYHVGSPCEEPFGICKGINVCKDLIHIARSLGCSSANIIDIGGGIPGRCGFILDKFSDAINATLEDVDPSIQIISEPGRYYVTSSTLAAAYVLNRKVVIVEGKKVHMYYVTDGVFGSFLEAVIYTEKRRPIVLTDNKLKSNEKYISTIWGPTCHPCDFILKEKLLPEADIGDWFVWSDMGAYSMCTFTEFNGFKPPTVHPVMKRSDWISMWQDINDQKDKFSKLQ